MIKIAPSILSADFGRLCEESRAVLEAGADWLHVDVMDGHFVPNLTLGPCVVQSLRKGVEGFFDVHLMICDPFTYAPEFAKAGADLICFHYESDYDVQRVISLIRGLGKKVGLAVKPKTPVEAVYPYLEQLDMVLVMTVEPGFGGQKFMLPMMEKTRALKEQIAARALNVLIEVDGGIAEDTIGFAAQSGVDVMVAGSAVYGKTDYRQAIARLREAATKDSTK